MLVRVQSGALMKIKIWTYIGFGWASGGTNDSPGGRFFFKRNMERAEGRYIALLEDVEYTPETWQAWDEVSLKEAIAIWWEKFDIFCGCVPNPYITFYD